MITLLKNIYYRRQPIELLIEDGKIIDLLAPGTTPETEVQLVDGRGGHLYPGFVDAHLHLLGHGMSLKQCGLEGVESIGALVEICRRHMVEHPLGQGDIFLGHGWNQTYLKEKRMPTREDLDRISTEHPVLLTRNCHHVLVANSAAIALLDAETLTEKQRLAGLFEEEAMGLLLDKVPRPSLDDLKEAILAAQGELFSLGITSVFSDDLSAVLPGEEQLVFDAFEALEASGQLLLNVYEQSLFRRSDTLAKFLDRGYRMDPPGRRFRRGPLKVLLDGSLGARTAKLKAPYSDDPTTNGILNHTPEELKKQIDLAASKGVDAAVHGIGDAAIELALDRIHDAYGDKGRHAIVHAQITSPDLLDKFRRYQVGAMIQPIFITDDIFVVHDRIGDRVEGSYAFKTLHHTVPTALSTDAPIVSPDPFACIFCAVTRQDLKQTEPPFLPEEALTIEEALRAYTETAYHFSYEENQKGQIAPGFTADLCLLDRHLESSGTEAIRSTGVLMTIVDGRVVYRKE
jgi:predicted amidohydrolase YtcJ